MKRQNRNKFLFVFYPEKDGKYSVLSPDFLSATCGEGKSHSRRMAGDLAKGLLDLEDYKHLEDPMWVLMLNNYTMIEQVNS